MSNNIEMNNSKKLTNNSQLKNNSKIQRNNLIVKNKLFTSNEITLIENPGILKNNLEFPTFRYEGGSGFKNVILQLRQNEGIQAEGGAMNYMMNNIKIKTTSGSNILSGFGRLLSGSTFFYNLFINEGNNVADISLAGVNPGNVGCFYIPAGKSIQLVSSTYVCSTVNLKVTGVAKTGGIITGYGLFYVNVTAEQTPGLVWINSFGDIIKQTLKQNDKISIDNGVLLGYDSTIKMHTSTVGGIKSTLFSGEGLITQIINENINPITIYLQGRSNSAYMEYICSKCKHSSHGGNISVSDMILSGGKKKRNYNKKNTKNTNKK